MAGADADSRDSQEVSPFQLAVWQNQLEVARYLVERCGVDPKQLNVFACGAQHWLGTTPSERAGPEGVELLPTARWLRGLGVDFHAVQRQGHSPLHKASWGGHLAFCRWLTLALTLILTLTKPSLSPNPSPSPNPSRDPNPNPNPNPNPSLLQVAAG